MSSFDFRYNCAYRKGIRPSTVYTRITILRCKYTHILYVYFNNTLLCICYRCIYTNMNIRIFALVLSSREKTKLNTEKFISPPQNALRSFPDNKHLVTLYKLSPPCLIRIPQDVLSRKTKINKTGRGFLFT
jgi:hypothetical protein